MLNEVEKISVTTTMNHTQSCIACKKVRITNKIRDPLHVKTNPKGTILKMPELYA